MQLLTPSTYQSMPWKNGLGVTEEIAREPGAGEFAWRLSRARMDQDTGFSIFPGYDRLLVVTEGAGFFLNERKVGTLQIHSFPGETPVHARLIAGPLVDFGVIYDRAKIRAAMSLVKGHEEPLELTDGTHFLYAADGDALVGEKRIPSGSTLRIDGALKTKFESAGTNCVLVSLFAI